MRYSQLLASACVAAAAMAGPAQQRPIPSKDPNIFIPSSSIEQKGDVGVRAHTNYMIYRGPTTPNQLENPFFAMDLRGPALARQGGIPGFHPNQLQKAYQTNGKSYGIIAIIDAFDYPTALNDFNAYASTFSLPQERSGNAFSATNPVFRVIYASGSQPAYNSGWALESSLDIEAAHGIAPAAKIVLIEAASNSYTDLMQAVDVANNLPGVTQVSMSFGGSEFSGETTYDSHFSNPNITYFAASGDTGGRVIYPSISPSVVGVGGTSLFLDANNNRSSESAWNGSGGGPSTVYSRPAFQNSIQSIVGTHRAAPDIALVADPNTGLGIYTAGSWQVVGGTSLATPLTAALANAGFGRRGNGELNFIYTHTGNFHDITTGSAGSFNATVGWDFITGFGTPIQRTSL